MSWTVSIDKGSGWEDITSLVDYRSIRRRQVCHNNLKPVVDTCRFRLAGGSECVTLVNALLAFSGEYITVKIQKDSSDYFVGLIRNNFSTSVTNTVGKVEIECVDKGFRLDKTITTNVLYTNYTLSNPSDKATSILHCLFTAAGFGESEVSFTAYNKTIDYFFVSSTDKLKYKDVIANFLHEYGLVYRFNESGVAVLYDVLNYTLPASPTKISSGATGDMLTSFAVQKKEKSYKAVEVKYYAHELLAGAKVFQDTTGGTSTYSCYIELDPGESYPVDSDVKPVYSEYKIPDRDVLLVISPTLVEEDTGVDIAEALVNYYRCGKVRFHSTSGGVITKFDITGNAVVKGDMTIYTAGDSTAEKKETIELKYLSTKADAELFAQYRMWYWNVSLWEYRLQTSTAVTCGQLIQLEEDTILGSLVNVRVVQVEEEEGTYSLVCEGVNTYTTQTVTVAGTQLIQPPLASFIQRSIDNRPTYDEVGTSGAIPIGTGNSTGDVTAPSVPTLV